MQWVIETAACSDVGLNRQNNEDAFGVFDDLRLYIVADGMGGHAAGEIASSRTVETIRRTLTESADTDITAVFDSAGNSSIDGRRLVMAVQEANRRLLELSRTLTESADTDITAVFDSAGNSSIDGRRLVMAVQEANRRLLELSRSDPKLHGMGTTVAALFFDARHESVAICHVGDSRVYRIRDGDIAQLTEDHTLVQHLINEGQMRSDQRRSSSQRHVLTQAVGASDEIRPELRLEQPRAGDVFVACTDGVHDAIDAEEIMQIALKVPRLETACRELIDLANRRGGKDNSTVLIVRCNPVAPTGS